MNLTVTYLIIRNKTVSNRLIMNQAIAYTNPFFVLIYKR